MEVRGAQTQERYLLFGLSLFNSLFPRPTNELFLDFVDKSAKAPKSAMSSVRRTRATSKRTAAETASALIKKRKFEGKPTGEASEPLEVSDPISVEVSELSGKASKTTRD